MATKKILTDLHLDGEIIASNLAGSNNGDQGISISGDVITLSNGGSITIPSGGDQLTSEQVQDIIGAMVSSNTETNISVTYNDATGKLDFVSTDTNTDTNTQLSSEQVQDIMGAAWVSGVNNTFVYDDVANTLRVDSVDTNTQLSDAQVRSKFSAGSNVAISAGGVISSIDTNTDTNTQRSDEEIRDISSAQWINGQNTTVVKNDAGNTIKIDSVDTTYVSSNFNHDDLSGFVAAEHVNWAASSAGVIHITNLPATAITSVQIAASQTAMLALTTQEGDVVVRSDENKTYMHNSGSAGTMADFTVLATPTGGVSSVDGAVGAVVLNHDNLTGFLANEHIDWTTDRGATNIHSGNYTNTNTTYDSGDFVDLTSDQDVGGIKTFNGTHLSIENPANTWKYLRFKSGTTTKWDVGTNEASDSGAFQFRPNGGNDNTAYVTTGGYFASDNQGTLWGSSNDGSGSGLDADLLDGLQLATGRNNVANQVVRTQGDGYIQAGWINTTSGNTASTITDIYVNTNDGYIRKATQAHFRSQVTDGSYPTKTGSGASGTWAIDISGTAATATKLSNIDTSFNGEYPMVINANGILYSHTNVKFEGSTGKLTAPIFVGNLSGNADWADQVDVNVSNAGSGEYNVMWNSGDTVYSTDGITINRDSKRITTPVIKSGTTSEGCEMKYNSTSKTLDFIFG